jgi:hypothetical protein
VTIVFVAYAVVVCVGIGGVLLTVLELLSVCHARSVEEAA